MEAWIKVYHDLSDHPKTYALADALGMRQYSAVGIVVSLWIWALIHAPDGDLTRFPDSAIARACHWDKKPADLVAALAESGFLDGRRLHDWDEYAGAIIEAEQTRREKTRKRVEAHRAKKSVTDALPGEGCNADVTRYMSVTGSLPGEGCNADVRKCNAPKKRREENIYTTTQLQPPTTRAREEAPGWFDPENPDAECDAGWLSEKSQYAIAQRIVDWVSRKDDFDALTETDEYGVIGTALPELIVGAMRSGIHPAAITKALQPVTALAECERCVAELIREEVGIDGLKAINAAWGQRAWANYQAEMKNASTWM